jgi:hypothetical protein
VAAHQRAVGARDALELRQAEARRGDQRGDGGCGELRIRLLAYPHQDLDLRVVDRAQFAGPSGFRREVAIVQLPPAQGFIS